MFKIIAGVVGALVVLIAITVALMIFTTDLGMQKAANLATITVAFFACGLLLVTTGLVIAVLALFVVINNLVEKKLNPLIDRLPPLLDKANETADTAKGTVTYIGEGVVSPLIKVSSILAAVRGGVSALLQNRNG
jgi:cell division protein FtsW (lipid II flippase)